MNTSTDGDGIKFRTLHLDSGREWRGGQNQVLLLCRGLAELGHETRVAAPPESPLARRLGRAGIMVYPLALRGDLRLSAAREIRRLIAELRPQLIHAHTAHAHALALRALPQQGAPPLVVSRRVDFAIGGNPFSRRKYLHPACRYIAISSGVRRVLLDGGIDARNIRVVHSGVDPRRFAGPGPGPRLRRELDVPEGTFVVGTIGALTDHKDHETLIRAAALAAGEDPALLVVIVGAGELQKKLYSVIDRLNAQHYVRLTGYRKDARACLESFDLFALSSHQEGLCTSIIDAMLTRVPVVATAVGGVPDLVRPEQTGRLVEPRSPEQLARAILELKARPELHRQFAENAARLALESFTAERMVAGTLEAYRDFLGPGRV